MNYMKEADLVLKDVKVKQVILNKSGKRAIRLDAWAVDKNERQFNTEVQNDVSTDDVRKRSRYYQSMIGTTILISDKETRYKQLPSTVIIFITQEEILVKDSRILELDEIVGEVKQSEEGEEVSMNILEIRIQKGIEQGGRDAVKKIVGNMVEKGMADGEIIKLSGCTQEMLE